MLGRAAEVAAPLVRTQTSANVLVEDLRMAVTCFFYIY